MVQRLVNAIARLPRKTDMDTVRRVVLADINASDIETMEQALNALAEFEGLIKPTGSPADAAEQLRVVDRENAIEPGVHLLNAHTGKGQQFDWVFIPGFEDFHIPGDRAVTREQLEEEMRVVLVMISRARHGVVVTSANSLVSKAGNPYRTKESRWWSAVAGICPMSAEDLSQHIAMLSAA